MNFKALPITLNPFMRPALLREAAAQPRYERRRPEQAPLYRLVQRHDETFTAEAAGLSVSRVSRLIAKLKTKGKT